MKLTREQWSTLKDYFLQQDRDKKGHVTKDHPMAKKCLRCWGYTTSLTDHSHKWPEICDHCVDVMNSDHPNYNPFTKSYA